MFIVFEGIDGCGKTTQAQKLEDLLRRRLGDGLVVRTREPGGWSGGESLRDMVLHGDFAHDWSEFFLFLLDRCEHVARVVAPALLRGSTVICERYNASTLAYQLFGRTLLPKEQVRFMEGLIAKAGLPEPDLVVYLDITVDTALKRVGTRGNADRIEGAGSSYYERVRDGYETLFEDSREGVWVKIDASRGADEVFEDVAAAYDRAAVGTKAWV